MKTKIKVLDKGFVRLVDHYGSDQRVVDAARTSYLKGTKQISQNRDLIRYLLRRHHTSPFEQCEITFHIKLPLAIGTQLLRHRTFSFNFESLRYSEASNDVYIPLDRDITKQSDSNKQGGSSTVCTLDNISNPDDYVDAGFGLSDFYSNFKFSECFKSSMEISQNYYKTFLKSNIRRELSRMVLPAAQYTECYAKVDLNNFFKFLKLRLDKHSQLEMQLYASAMYEVSKPLYPICFEAFEDYCLNNINFSRLDCDALFLTLSKNKDMLNLLKENADKVFENKREKEEFLEKCKKILDKD